MTTTQIEDADGNTAEVSTARGEIELAIGGVPGYVDAETGEISISLIMTPRQARALARQLLAQADATEYGDES